MKKLWLLLLVFILLISCNIKKENYCLYAKGETSSYIIAIVNTSVISLKFEETGEEGKKLLDFLSLKANVIFPLTKDTEKEIMQLLENLSNEIGEYSSLLEGAIEYSPVLIKSDVVSSYSQKLGFDVKPFIEKIARKKAYSFYLADIKEIKDSKRVHFSLWFDEVLALSDRR